MVNILMPGSKIKRQNKVKKKKKVEVSSTAEAISKCLVSAMTSKGKKIQVATL